MEAVIAAIAGAGANKLFSSKGGGNDQTTTQTPQFYPGFDRLANPLIGGTLGTYNRPYQEYPDETVAPLNDDQYTGIAALRAAYEDPTSRGRYDDIARRFSAAASRQAAPGTSSAIQARMSPYQDLVIDRALARMNTEDQTSMRNLRAANAGRNKFGSGAALSEATLAGAQDQNRGDAITRLLQSGFGNAQSQFNTDNEMANRTADQNRLALGNAASAVGQGDSANLAKIQALIGGGGMEQGNTQQYITDRYNRWNQGQNYGDEQNRKAASILFASPQGSTQTSPGPSAFGQGAGLGLAAYGLATRNGKNPFDFLSNNPNVSSQFPEGMWANGGIARFADGGGKWDDPAAAARRAKISAVISDLLNNLRPPGVSLQGMGAVADRGAGIASREDMAPPYPEEQYDPGPAKVGPEAQLPPTSDRAAGTESREKLAEIIQDLAGRGRVMPSEAAPDASAAALPEVVVPERGPARALNEIVGAGGEAPPPVPPSADMLIGADKSSTGSRYQEIIDELLKRQDPKSDLSHMLMKAGAAMMASKSRTALGAAGEGLGAALDESTKLGEKDMDRRLKAAGLLGTLDSKQQALMQRASEAAQRAQASQSRLESAERNFTLNIGSRQAAIDAKIQYESDRNEARRLDTLVRAATADRATDQKRDAASDKNAIAQRKAAESEWKVDERGYLMRPDGDGLFKYATGPDGGKVKGNKVSSTGSKALPNAQQLAQVLADEESGSPGGAVSAAHWVRAREILTAPNTFMAQYYIEKIGQGGLPGKTGTEARDRMNAARPPPPVAQAGAPPPPAAAPAAGSSRDTPIRGISTDAEFNKLPKGPWFVNPIDGKILQKKTGRE